MTDDRQIVRAAQKAAYGQPVRNPLLWEAGRILATPYDPSWALPNASNGALRAAVYVPAK